MKDFFINELIILGNTFKVWQVIVISILLILIIAITFILSNSNKKKKKEKKESIKNTNNEIEEESIKLSNKTTHIEKNEIVKETKMTDTKTKETNKIKEPNKIIPRGKFEITLRNDGYHFSLIASNGQLLYDSFSFSSLQGAKSGLETFKKSVDEGNSTIYKDKFDRYRYIINKRYVGENYINKNSCENSLNSVKKFTKNAVISEYVNDKDGEQKYNEFKKNIKTISDEDWKIELEKDYKPSGKYEIEKEEDGYHFYLSANNGQLLYSSQSYTTQDSALKGINSFKRAVFLANFHVDGDKFGKFRFIIRGGGSQVYVGESFTTKKSALSNADSVRNFAMSAQIIPYNN